MTSPLHTSSPWDDARDGAFFSLTAHLCSPAFCAGASALLASYDDEPAPATRARQTAPTHPRTTAFAA